MTIVLMLLLQLATLLALAKLMRDTRNELRALGQDLRGLVPCGMTVPSPPPSFAAAAPPAPLRERPPAAPGPGAAGEAFEEEDDEKTVVQPIDSGGGAPRP